MDREGGPGRRKDDGATAEGDVLRCRFTTEQLQLMDQAAELEVTPHMLQQHQISSLSKKIAEEAKIVKQKCQELKYLQEQIDTTVSRMNLTTSLAEEYAKIQSTTQAIRNLHSDIDEKIDALCPLPSQITIGEGGPPKYALPSVGRARIVTNAASSSSSKGDDGITEMNQYTEHSSANYRRFDLKNVHATQSDSFRRVDAREQNDTFGVATASEKVGIREYMYEYQLVERNSCSISKTDKSLEQGDINIDPIPFDARDLCTEKNGRVNFVSYQTSMAHPISRLPSNLEPLQFSPQHGNIRDNSRVLHCQATQDCTHDNPSESMTLVSSDLKQDEEQKQTTKKPTRKKFPQKLMEALQEKSNEDSVAWLPDGLSFVILKPEKFVANALKQNIVKYKSIIRTLKRWQFQRFFSGHGVDCFSHPLFRKDRPELVKLIEHEKPMEDYVDEISAIHNVDITAPSLAGIDKLCPYASITSQSEHRFTY